MTDRGISEVLNSVHEISSVDILNISGNYIGKSSYFNTLSTKLVDFINF